jgi:hypothetical protein
MSNVLKMLSRGGAAAAETDPNFKQTVLLLHGDGTNGAQNNTFLDSSSNNFTITRNPATGPNAPTQGTFSPFSVGAGEWSNYFDGTDDRLSIANNAAFDFGTGNFTIECWFYLVADATATAGGTRGANIVSVIPSSGAVNGYALYLTGNSTTTGTGIVFENTVSNTGYFATYTATIAKNTWHHVAVARSGTTTKLFFNGAEVVSTTLGNQTVSNYSNATNIGASTYTGYTSNFPGYLSNVRVVKGRAVYTSAFTPSTVPLGATSGGTNPPQGTETSLLTCQSNRFVDNGVANSGTGFTITRNGDVRVTPFSPFAPSAAYDPAVNGGSGYFDGTGDWLTAPDNAAFDLTGDFTIECWVYASSVSVTDSLVARWKTSNQEFLLWLASGTPAFYFAPFSVSTALLTSSKAIAASSWNHICVTRSSNSFTMYLNGESVATATNSGTFTNTTAPVEIGFLTDFAGYDYTGYIAGVRLIKGGVQTPAAGGPTSPPTAVSGTSLLLNFTNAGIFDNTGKNVLETVGNAQIDTTTKKFGTGSMEFDGTGDYLVAPSNSELILSGDFTIECWAYRSASGNYRLFTLGDSVGTSGIEIYVSGTPTGTWVVYSNNATRITGSSATREVWTYLAVVRSGSTVTLYVDGTASGSTWSSSATFSGRFFVGAEFYNNTVTADTNGFIDDLRITKGVARYPTEPFPTAPFPDL